MSSHANDLLFAGFLTGYRGGVRRAIAARSLATAVLAFGLVVLVAIAEKKSGIFGAANRALEDIVFSVILPVGLLWTSTRILEPLRLDVAVAPLARFGPSRRSVALGLIVASMLAGAAFAAVAAGATAILAHDPTAPPAALDAFTCAWIGALTASAYAALFALGATFGARGGGRFWALALDFVLGSTGGFAALIVPRAHALNLLGGEPPLLLSQPASAALLATIAVAFTALALARCAP
jgi:hypothetical protein